MDGGKIKQFNNIPAAGISFTRPCIKETILDVVLLNSFTCGSAQAEDLSRLRKAADVVTNCFVALDAKTGDEIWTVRLPRQAKTNPVIDKKDGTIYYGTWEKTFCALDGKNNMIKWDFKLDGDADGSPSLGGDNTVFIGPAIIGYMHSTRLRAGLSGIFQQAAK